MEGCVQLQKSPHLSLSFLGRNFFSYPPKNSRYQLASLEKLNPKSLFYFQHLCKRYLCGYISCISFQIKSLFNPLQDHQTMLYQPQLACLNKMFKFRFSTAIIIQVFSFRKKHTLLWSTYLSKLREVGTPSLEVLPFEPLHTNTNA